MPIGTSSFAVLGILYNELKTNTDTLMAQEGAIVQITHCFILKYIYIKNLTKCFFKCNISVTAIGTETKKSNLLRLSNVSDISSHYNKQSVDRV